MSNQQKSKKILAVGLHARISGSNLCFILLPEQLGIGDLEALGFCFCFLLVMLKLRRDGCWYGDSLGVSRHRQWRP